MYASYMYFFCDFSMYIFNRYMEIIILILGTHRFYAFENIHLYRCFKQNFRIAIESPYNTANFLK